LYHLIYHLDSLCSLWEENAVLERSTCVYKHLFLSTGPDTSLDI